MVRSFNLTLFALLLTAVSGFGQIIIPGIGYPGGGIPFPGTHRRATQNLGPTQNFTGGLRQITSNDLTLETEDKVVITIQLPNAAKYILTSGNSGRNRDFQPGDRVSIDAVEDQNTGDYRAVRVTQLRQGTPEERAAASQPVDSSPTASGGRSNGDDDPDRPILRRAPSADSASASSPASTPSSAPAEPGPYDPGAPVLRRGNPAPEAASRQDSQPAVVADARPSIEANDSNGVTRLPDAPHVDPNAAEPDAVSPGDPHHGVYPRMPQSGDPVIDQAREAAFSFTETLPNYVVKQFTTRYETEAASGNHTSWRALDNVTADVVCENGTEKYKNILVNGRPPKGSVEQTGSWSSGEFASLMQDVLSPLTNADFKGKRSTTIANRDAFRYDFSVEQPNSHWHVYAEAQSYVPAYTGSIWIDKQTYRALRIELAAQNMPRSFPLDTVESAIDYDNVLIGDSKFLLPVHSEALSCERGTAECSRNVIDFRDYKKFSADSSITFNDSTN